MRLDGKVAIVTGATRGIGASMASRFAEEGAKVVVAGRNRDRGRQVEKRITDAGGTAIYVPTDVSVEADVRELMAQTEKHFGTVHVLVNNAAATDAQETKGLADYTTEEFDYIVRVALYGTFWCCKYAIPMMVTNGGGSLINISSGGAVQGFPGIPAYSAAKSGIHGLTLSLAADYGPQGIRANVIAVGLIHDELTDALFSAPGMQNALERMQMIHREGKPDDIAGLALYMASDDSSFMTGQVVRMDGGITLKGGLNDVQVGDAYEAGRPGR